MADNNQPPAYPALQTFRELGIPLDSALSVSVPELWLRTDERMRELAFRMDSSRTKRRIASSLEGQTVLLQGIDAPEIVGSIRPHGEGEVLTVEFEVVVADGTDSFRFVLRLLPDNINYGIQSRRKLMDEVWGGGCVPRKLRDDLMSGVTTCESVARLAERFGTVVIEDDVQWDWAPSWEFPSVSLPTGSETLHTLISIDRGIEYAVLSTWTLTIEERPSVASGVRVSMVFDPESKELLASWDQQWRELF